MWWAVYITIVLGPHKHTTVITPQVFGSFGECEQFIEKSAATPPPQKKSTIMISCGDALGGK